MRSILRRFVLAATAFLLVASSLPAVAQTTGDLRGQVTDQAGDALPGVTVTLESTEVLGGPWVAFTGTDGYYQFPKLQPGRYVIRFELDSFATQAREDVPVRLDQTTQLNAQLSRADVSEVIVVTAEAPVVDPEQTGLQQTYNIEYLDKAAIGSANRSYQAVIGQAAGTDGGANPRVFGATLGENNYLIDGVTTTDPVTSTFGTNFNFDAIQEIAFHSAGYEAEYGGATGGLVNVITKSGGNQFSGTVDVRYRDTDFQESGDHFDPDAQDVKFVNPGFTLGGPLMRDRLWFYTAYEYTDAEQTPAGAPTTRNFVGSYYLGKLTYQLSDGWRAVLKYSADPADIDNDDAGPLVTADANQFQEQGGDITSLIVDGVVGDNLFWDAKVGINRQELNAFPQAQPIDGPPSHFDRATSITSGNNPNAQFSDRDRDEFKTSATWFLGDLAGSHEVKAGVEYTDLTFRSENFTTAGGFRYEDNAGPFVLWYEPNAGATTHDGAMQTAFLQDAWRLSPNLTLKGGLRYDTVAYDNDAGTEVADFDLLQPRFGLAWDVAGDAETVVRGSWGRYMHPNALTLPSFARVANLPSFAYLSCSRFLGDPSTCEARFGGTLTAGGITVPTWIADPDGFDPNGYLLIAGNVFASAPNQIASDLDAMYTDEWSIGVERSLTPRTSVELVYVDREWNDIFEDTCNGNLEDGFSADAACDFYVMANLPQLQRTFEGVVLRLESRDVKNLTAVASYTYGDSQGNVGYTQNAGAAFDVFPVHFVNRFGRDDREHRVKLNGFYRMPWDLTLGFDAFWSSDFFWTPQAFADPYGVEFLERRGNREGDDVWQLDLELSKYLRFGAADLRLIGTVINVFSEEAVTQVCTSDVGCGDVALGDPLNWQNPRRYELGFRVEF